MTVLEVVTAAVDVEVGGEIVVGGVDDDGSVWSIVVSSSNVAGIVNEGGVDDDVSVCSLMVSSANVWGKTVDGCVDVDDSEVVCGTRVEKRDAAGVVGSFILVSVPGRSTVI